MTDTPKEAASVEPTKGEPPARAAPTARTRIAASYRWLKHRVGRAYQILKALKQSAEAESEFAATRRIYVHIFTDRADAEGRGPGSAQMHVSFGNARLAEQRIETDRAKEQGIERALAQFKWAEEVDPDDDYVHRSLCDGLRVAEDLDEALTECEQAVKKAPDRVENLISLGVVLIERDDLDRAREVGEAALQQAPKSPLVHVMLGEMHKARGDHDMASAETDHALSEYNQARTEYESAFRRAPGDAGLRLEFRNIFGKEGDLLRQLKRFDELEVTYRKAIDQLPKDADMHRNLVDALWRRGRLDAAIDEYRQATKLDSKAPMGYFGLAVALNQKANSAGEEGSRIDLLTEACRVLTEGLRQAPDDPDLRRARAAIAAKLPESAGCALESVPGGQR